jgi:hypothetical protein
MSLRNQARLYLEHYYVPTLLHRQLSRAYRTSPSKIKASQRRLLLDLLSQVMQSCHLRPRPPCTPATYDHVTQSLFGDDDDFSFSVEDPEISFSSDVEFSDDSVSVEVEVSDDSFSGEVVIEVSDNDSVKCLFYILPQIHDNTAINFWHSNSGFSDVTDELSVCTVECSCDV